MMRKKREKLFATNSGAYEGRVSGVAVEPRPATGAAHHCDWTHL